MKRIILLGNGFDLAHGMKTSYKSFIDDYWSKTITEIQESTLDKPFENDEIKIKNSPSKRITKNTFQDLERGIKEYQTTLVFKNTFLKELTDKSYLNNWVDVENEYYVLLKKSYDKIKFPRNDYNVKELNADFEKIKNKLGEYLNAVEKTFNDNLGGEHLRTKRIIGHKIYRPFKLKDFSEIALNQKAEFEYSLIKKDIEALAQDQISMDDLNEKNKKLISRIDLDNALSSIRELLQSESAINFFDLIPDQTLFLNFNYTFTEKIYENPREFDQFNEDKFTSTEFVHIHGTTDSRDNNDIIFGFGDELDDEYKSIEKLNDNTYLENIKSINYLETDNYKKLLEFVNSGNFQIFIFGHSCGISDRTMLNTIFEHDNCASIKLFFHQRSENNDNYSDIIRNISRNFNDKAKMRDRVVNKNYCEPLR
ncbi:AbiH family protein [Winogradskyella vidalii]|uniref:AbiH family protein n=1 Tax=Winogradskyella vidalii TaxID=2615024 RepID=UPI0015CC7EDA|nr:AbiH family protein [Winogradskyella vidalii]